MQRGILTILLCYAAGETIHRVAAIPVTGNVIGMGLFVLVLFVRAAPAPGEEAVAGALLRVLPMLFVPAGVGFIDYLPLLRRELLPIAAAILGSTVLTMAGCAWVAVGVERWRRVPRHAPTDPCQQARSA